MAKGKLITFEGCEGVGKSSQLRLLVEYCQKNGIDAFFTREPGGTPISESIRGIILDAKNTAMSDDTELLLYTAARAQLVREIIIPKLEQGKIVFCDRFVDSTVAYQGYARGIDLQKIDYLNALALGSLKIDRTIFLNLSPMQAFGRKGGASVTDRLEQQSLDFHMKVYEGYCEQARRHPDRIVSIDASGVKLITHGKIVSAILEVLA